MSQTSTRLLLPATLKPVSHRVQYEMHRGLENLLRIKAHKLNQAPIHLQKASYRLCGWETCTEHHCTTFFKFSTIVETFSDCGNFGSRRKHKLAQADSRRANQQTGSAPSLTWSEKVHLHLPLGGVLREGTWCSVKPVA